MTLHDWMTETLTRELRPVRLTITDESDQHAGHGGWREGGETHFRVDVVADAFVGKSRVERHRVVNTLLAGAFGRGLHALAIHASAPSEQARA